jgi:hypothetical protein
LVVQIADGQHGRQKHGYRYFQQAKTRLVSPQGVIAQYEAMCRSGSGFVHFMINDGLAGKNGQGCFHFMTPVGVLRRPDCKDMVVEKNANIMVASMTPQTTINALLSCLARLSMCAH